jgi:transcription elongation factor Elf1
MEKIDKLIVIHCENEAERKYLTCSYKCPFCGSDQLEGDDTDVDNAWATLQVICAGCGREWEDVYYFAGMSRTR